MRASVAVLALLAAACASVPPRVGAPAPAAADGIEPAGSAANPPVGGVDLPSGHSISADLALVPMLSTLFRLLTTSGQTTTSVTVFAPTDDAFGRLAPGTVDALLKPENRGTLVRFVTLHLVSGRLTSADLVHRITAGGGRATLTSVAGEPLTLTMTGSVVTLTDGGGNRSYVEVADVRARDGVIHVVNGVLVPRVR